MVDPESLLYQHSYYKPQIDRAIALTEKYVSENKLILTGGMAIDLALRLKGQQLYDDDELPDYDIISDRNLDHANTLAKILCEAGLPDVNVINAIHITTVKVRFKRTVLLDATYIPPDCFKRIPYLDANHLRVVHPHYQFIDQRLSLSHLMADTGRSLNAVNRLKKDINRNIILRENYPIKTPKIKPETKKLSIPLDLIRVDKSQLTDVNENACVYVGPTCIAGYVGYFIMMSKHDPSMYKISIGDATLDFLIPDNTPVRLLSCSIESLNSYIKDPVMYRPLINLKPISMRSGIYDFVDTYGTRVGCNIVELSSSLKVCVASVDYLLMEMLRDRIYISSEPYSSRYQRLVDVVDQMRAREDSHEMWWPSIDCYGRDDLPEYRVFAIERLLDPEAAKTLKPKHSYPSPPKCKIRDGFVQTNSHHFLIDGIEDSSLKHTNYKYVMDEFKLFIDKKRNEE